MSTRDRGWYPDTTDPSRQVYWNGEEWAGSRSAPERQPNVAVAPGWYEDPEQAATLRYWDGGAWTDQRAPLASIPRDTSKPGDLGVGVVLALLIPIVGFFYGLFLLIRGNGAGGWVILCSFLGGVFWTIAIGVVIGLGG